MTATQHPAQGPSTPSIAPPPPAKQLTFRQAMRFLRGFQSADMLRGMSSFPGDSGLIEMRMLRPGFLFVRDPEHARQVLVTNQDNYPKGSDYKVLAILLGQGLLTNEDPVSWQRNRKMVQPLFAKRHLSPMAVHMTAATNDWLDGLERRTKNGDQLDISEEMMALTLDVVCRALFGAATDQRQTVLVGKAMELLLHAAQVNIRVAGIYDVVSENPRIGLEFEDLLPLRRRAWNKAQRGKAQLDEIVHGLIDARAASGAEGGEDLLSLLLAARDERGELGREQVRDEVMTFLGAGHETTANALTWMWMVLSQHPDARRRMQEEVDEVLSGRTPEYADAEKLPWTTACFHEAMRLYPPVPAFSRVAAGEDEIDGVRVQRGTGVAVAPYLLHRNPRLWDNPEGFDPERFMPGAGKDRPKLAYMPFGGGRRVCVGQGFAVLEGVLLAATIAQRVRFDLVPGTRVRNDVAITLRPRDGMPMTVQHRD